MKSRDSTPKRPIRRAVGALALCLGFFFAPATDSTLDARDDSGTGRRARDDVAAAVAAIREIGGTVRPFRRQTEKLEVEFHLSGRGLTDDGLAYLAALKDIVSLNLRDTKITGAGLKHLKDLKTLRWLHLERTAVDDEGLAHLAGLVNLEYLNLYGTRITDAALEHLKKLRKLRRLYVWKTEVTGAGAERLERRLPGLEVVRGVDLSKLPEYVDEELDVPEPKEDLKWIATSDRSAAPKSETGLNTQVFFENKSARRVKLYWVSYGNELKLYAELDPGESRQQNTYSRNTWLITDEKDRPLGYFVVGEEIARAVIPAQEEKP